MDASIEMVNACIRTDERMQMRVAANAVDGLDMRQLPVKLTADLPPRVRAPNEQ